MSHKRAFEALNATLQDIRNSQDLMGGLVVLLSGDFRQTLPVIQRGTPADEINSCLKKSVLWSHIEQYHLVQNMRVSLHNDCDARQFSGDLLKIGEGRMKTDQHKMISFPENFGHMVASAEELIASVFPDLQNNHYDPEWLSCRAILAPKNDDVNKINSKIMNIIHGEVKSYLSIDSITEEEQALHYPVEFLNTLELPGIPPHKLELQLGIPVILLRNLEPPRLCNGTRLLITSLKENVIEAKILTGSAKGEEVLIPRIPITTANLPFNFKRLQFPLKVAFSMTINKAQGQTLQVAGLYLETQCFSHGQLYVACSRVSSGKNLYIFTKDRKAVNIVYKSVL
ncbi:ATP-dependent DNA helicase PIF1-like [Macrosteles quadrilineatus]|nr:ATP-dependent DNA helicase PIF1-like [Macrosteles quadrilineatus]